MRSPSRNPRHSARRRRTLLALPFQSDDVGCSTGERGGIGCTRTPLPSYRTYERFLQHSRSSSRLPERGVVFAARTRGSTAEFRFPHDAFGDSSPTYRFSLYRTRYLPSEVRGPTPTCEESGRAAWSDEILVIPLPVPDPVRVLVVRTGSAPVSHTWEIHILLKDTCMLLIRVRPTGIFSLPGSTANVHRRLRLCPTRLPGRHSRCSFPSTRLAIQVRERTTSGEGSWGLS